MQFIEQARAPSAVSADATTARRHGRGIGFGPAAVAALTTAWWSTAHAGDASNTSAELQPGVLLAVGIVLILCGLAHRHHHRLGRSLAALTFKSAVQLDQLGRLIVRMPSRVAAVSSVLALFVLAVVASSAVADRPPADDARSPMGRSN